MGPQKNMYAENEVHFFFVPWAIQLALHFLLSPPVRPKCGTGPMKTRHLATPRREQPMIHEGTTPDSRSVFFTFNTGNSISDGKDLPQPIKLVSSQYRYVRHLEKCKKADSVGLP